MDDEASPEPTTGSNGGASIQPVPADASFHADQHRMPVPLERRLRRLAGRKGAYRGPIVANTRGWVSRDTRWHIFAARFLDFAMLTPEHLVLCSTGFFTRRPRRQVLREPLTRLFVTKIGPEPTRTLRIVGDFSRPIRIELRDDPDSVTFINELIARTPIEAAHRRGDPWSASEMDAPAPIDPPAPKEVPAPVDADPPGEESAAP
jgi:hypothetical protein